ncbi:hypothetical protein ADUPG1_008191 [Aduncisulcus paluster]|uniref:SMP-LTD domain-containing protein n=1 Tax=Aduncisulcus paluster TaxID=2918883 RepID=A0ABQ5KU25_9EUKA|nr:hypothetical protein ADUPG1_008191 [Aduncisulcus paluster]
MSLSLTWSLEAKKFIEEALSKAIDYLYNLISVRCSEWLDMEFSGQTTKLIVGFDPPAIEIAELSKIGKSGTIGTSLSIQSSDILQFKGKIKTKKQLIPIHQFPTQSCGFRSRSTHIFDLKRLNINVFIKFSVSFGGSSKNEASDISFLDAIKSRILSLTIQECTIKQFDYSLDIPIYRHFPRNIKKIIHDFLVSKLSLLSGKTFNHISIP